MRRHLLDTNILVHYVRKSPLYSIIEKRENLSSEDSLILISVVTYAEILSFATQQNWGPEKIKKIEQLLSRLVIIDINSADEKLIMTYAEIDAYSKNKLPQKLLGRSIKMGKNDLWIASTAHVANATLLTTDSDFDHLHKTYIELKKITAP
jgi:tRNA(fMet)-specific endonuclease VapC